MSKNPPAHPPAKGRAAWFASLWASWRAALRFDRSQITAFQALRSTFGFVLPLALGLVTGQVTVGILIASGALSIGTIGLRDNPPSAPLPEIAMLGERIDQAMSALAAALREGRQAHAIPDLQQALRALQSAVKANRQAPDQARAQWHFLIGEAKHIVANIQAMRQLLLTGSFG